MNFKDLLFPFTLAILSTLAVQYFFQRKVDPTKTGSEFVAPSNKESAEPLNLEIDYIDNQTAKADEVTDVETLNTSLKLTTAGAGLQYFAFKRPLAGKPGSLPVVEPGVLKEQKAFIVALNGIDSTPYNYELIENKKENDYTHLTYKAETKKVVIYKEFIISNFNYNIKLKLTVEPKEGFIAKPRIFIPAPFIADVSVADINSGIIYSQNNILKKTIKQVGNIGWARPELFGVEDRYFAFVLIKDDQKFTQRAYFKPVEFDKLIAILEGPAVKEKTAWQMEFFAGPKESEILSSVDRRLDGLLDFGWLAFISKPLLWLLKLLYSYVKNYGIAIIILTLILKLLMLPLTIKGERGARKGMEVQKHLQYLEQKHKHDPETLNYERTEYLKKHGSAMLGCFPMLLQIPVWIGLNRVLSNALELYKAPFFWIPDLSAKDPYFILPVLMAIGMALTTASVGNARQRLSSVLMAVVVAGVFSGLASGLTLFIAVSTWLGLLQTRVQKALNI